MTGSTLGRLRQLKEDVLANGKVESNELEVLRQELYSDGKVGRQQADFLVELYKQTQRPNRAFEQFFYQTVKNHVLSDGTIRAEETAWLRQLLLRDRRIKDRERKFLTELKGEARQVGPEFDALFAECMS